MKVLKWLFAGAAALVLLLLLGGMLLPASFTVARSVLVTAPPERVYALVADPREWKRWSAWNRRDPAMVVSYSGPASGAGAGWAWKSAQEGDGRMRFTAAEPPARVAYELVFPDFEAPSRGELRFVPEASGTRVHWTMSGDVGANPLWHWFAAFADRLVGPDFDAGLANLKAEAEKSAG